MEAILTQLIQSQGIWAVLFVFLLLYTIKKNDKLDELQDAREKEYRELLLELTDKFSIVNEINSKLVQRSFNKYIKQTLHQPLIFHSFYISSGKQQVLC